MRVSVILSNYNYANYISRALDSLLSQTDIPDEIIVVDDGSTDNSRAVIDAYDDRIIKIFQENGGQASAISAGFARATGDMICLLDADDVFFPEKIATLKQAYKANPLAQWIFHDLKHIASGTEKSFDPPHQKITQKIIDARQNMAKGFIGYDAPATSGLSFRRDFIAPLFPLPAARSIYISDHYLKFFALAKGQGLHLPVCLSGQIIHGANLYTGLTDKLTTRARIFIHTADCLSVAAPEIKKFCNNLMAQGMADARKTGMPRDLQNIVGKYLKKLSFEDRVFLSLKAHIKSLLPARK